MSEESFIKMCKTINAGEDLPLEMVKRTYHNIRKNQIHTFRNRFSMHEISMKSWLLLGKDYECIPL
jgi:Sec7-like guanine-nucleotide exchange factor